MCLLIEPAEPEAPPAPVDWDRPGWLAKSPLLGLKSIQKSKKIGPEMVPGGSGSALGPSWAMDVKKNSPGLGFEVGFGHQKGAREGPKGSPGEAKRGPRASQDRFFGCLCSMPILRSIFHRFWDGFGTVFGIKN